MQPVDALIRDSEGFHLRGQQKTRLETFVDALLLRRKATTAS